MSLSSRLRPATIRRAKHAAWFIARYMVDRICRQRRSKHDKTDRACDSLARVAMLSMTRTQQLGARHAARQKTPEIEQRVGAGRLHVHGHAGPSPTAISPGTMDSGSGPKRDDFAPGVGRDAAHVVVHRRQHGNWILRDVHAGEDAGRFRDSG